MSRIVHPEAGPTGPYAASAGKNELLMRTSEGVTSLKYFEQDTTKPGNPSVNLGQEIKPLLDADAKDLLLFATVVNSFGRQRAGFSVAPQVRNRHRWHRGYVTCTYQPTRKRVPDVLVWEGIHTLPVAMGELVQFIEGVQFGTKRIFAILRKADGSKALAEWTEQDGPDRLADGTLVPQTWQVLTRRLTRSEYSNQNWGAVFVRITGVQESVTVKVSARTRDSDLFRELTCHHLTNDSWCAEGLESDPPAICLGQILSGLRGEWVQLLIEGTGTCSIDVAIGNSSNELKPDHGSIIPCLSGSVCNYTLFPRS